MSGSKAASLFQVPARLCNEADFAVPVALTRSVYAKYVDVPYLTADEQQQCLWRILRDARKDIDCWWGEDNDMDEFDVDCLVPQGRHECCGTLCTSYVTLKAVYHTDEAGKTSVVISFPQEAKL